MALGRMEGEWPVGVASLVGLHVPLHLLPRAFPWIATRAAATILNAIEMNCHIWDTSIQNC